MTVLILEAAPFARLAMIKLRALGRALLRALDAFAAAKMRNAVPEHKLRRAQREINRYRRLMHSDHAPAARG
jgi:hypothetical protein